MKIHQDAANIATQTILRISNNEVKKGLCDVFAARLEQLGLHIRKTKLSPIEANELLIQEAKKLRNEQYGAHE